MFWRNGDLIMTPLRFAVCGAGFWARYQLAAWKGLPGAACVAVLDLDRGRAEALAAAYDVPSVYTDAEAMLASESLDFVDIIAAPKAHRTLTELAARHGVAVICQKPLAESLEEARGMVKTCAHAGVLLFVHENWRWQPPLRALADVLRSGEIGAAFRARIDFVTSFPVFDNQPFLATLPRFIIADIGVHLLDVARFLFGEASSVYAQTQRINPQITGEDVATVMTRHGDCTVVTNMSYASRTEHEKFPETFVMVEGSKGSVELVVGGELRITTKDGTRVQPCPLPPLAWAEPDYALVHAGMQACVKHLLSALRSETAAETTGADNLQTLELVFAAYDSATSGKAIALSPSAD